MVTSHFELGTEDQNLYQVHSRREIVRLLENIADQRQMITLSLRGGADMVLTTLLGVDDKNNRVYLDCSQNAELNRQIVSGEEVNFESMLDKVRILFSVERIKDCTHANQPALCFAVPTSLIRLQRREFFRVNTPSQQAAQCVIPTPSGSYTLALVDISCGGVAILDERRQLNTNVGHEYPGCQIDLGDSGSLQVTLQVRNHLDLTLLNGRTQRRVGCQFIHQPPGMLTTVQRYIMALERERNARLTGLF